jgi:aryl-alcohol dehydrogenase-like predicted oxidoreductase
MNSLLSRFMLGTVQLGMSYGINNKTGKPSLEQSLSLLEFAYDQGVRNLDTAEAYGESQMVIGQFHRLNPHKKFQISGKFKDVNSFQLHDQFQKSSKELGVTEFYSYSYHDFKLISDLELRRQLISLKDGRKIYKVGVSVYTNEEFSAAISMDHIDIIQIPFNILDNWKIRGSLIKAASEKGKEVHVRSVFLQGLFFKSVENLPSKLERLRPVLIRAAALATNLNLSLEEVALFYPFSYQEISKVLIGVETKEQLAKNLRLLNSGLPQIDLRVMEELRAASDLIDPRNWT